MPSERAKSQGVRDGELSAWGVQGSQIQGCNFDYGTSGMAVVARMELQQLQHTGGETLRLSDLPP